MQAEVLAAELAGHIERRLGKTIASQLQRVGSHAIFEGMQDVGRCPKESVGWHQAVDPGVRALEVVPVDEVTDPRTGVRQVEKHSRFHALAPERSPESFDLAQSLRMPGCGHDLADATLLEFLVKRAFAPPGRVLTAVAARP